MEEPQLDRRPQDALTDSSGEEPPALQESSLCAYHTDDDEGENPPNAFSSEETASSCWSPRCLNNNNSTAAYFEHSNSTSFHYTTEELNMLEEPTQESTFTRFRPICIVTTSTLPWFTGTSINPLLRAAYILKYQQQHFQQHDVTLVVPWLYEPADRQALYGDEWKDPDKTPGHQEEFLRHWLAHTAKLPLEAQGLRIRWYPSKYHPSLHSIFAMGDIMMILQDEDDNIAQHHQNDSICILEEPEHLNFYKAAGVNWRHKFAHVIGIIHTNYRAYAASKSFVAAPIVSLASSLFVRAYCDKVIKLSDVLQTYAAEKEVVCNVHGIRTDFLSTSQKKTQGIYFVGKLLWAKGLDRLLDLQQFYKKKTKSYFAMDIYGSGPEEQEIIKCFQGKSMFYSHKLPVTFRGRQDHAELQSYKIFVNPSVTEVLCTTTAEAIAMGKFAIVPNHPSNVFFQQFPNCLMYNSRSEFVSHLNYALEHEPEPLLEDLAYMLTWEAATQRLFEVGAVSQRDAARRERLEGNRHDQIAKFHNDLFKGHKGDVLRKVLGAGPVADQFKYEIERQPSILSASS